MKKLLFITFLTSGIWSCTTEIPAKDKEHNKEDQRIETIVRPVYFQNGLWNKHKGKYYVNLQWYTDYDFPTFLPYYNTIIRIESGQVVAVYDNHYEYFNRIGIEVSPQWQNATFLITQTVQGLGTSEPVSLTISRN